MTIFKSCLVALFSLCFMPLLYGQYDKQFIQNIPKYDRRAFHFGFTIGLSNSTFAPKYSETFQDYFTNIEIGEIAGFNVGIVTDARISKHFNVRFVPNLTLVERKIDYTLQPIVVAINGLPFSEVQKSHESSIFTFPISIKYRTTRRGNFRPYVFAGAYYWRDISSDKNLEDLEVLNLKSTDFGVHAGAGMDFYLEFFKFGIEIRYDYGLQDVTREEGNIYYDAFEQINQRCLKINLTFE